MEGSKWRERKQRKQTRIGTAVKLLKLWQVLAGKRVIERHIVSSLESRFLSTF